MDLMEIGTYENSWGTCYNTVPRIDWQVALLLYDTDFQSSYLMWDLNIEYDFRLQNYTDTAYFLLWFKQK